MTLQHRHGPHDEGGESKLRLVLILTCVFFGAEVAGGLLANSLALLSDAGHMLVDTSAFLLALLAARQGRRPPDCKRTYGYRRFEVLAALGNGALLLLISGGILREALLRLREPRIVQVNLMFLVAALGLAINLLGLWLLRGNRDTNLNLRGAFLHVAGDTLGSVGTVASAIVIGLTGWNQADPVASILISGLILRGAVHLIRESLHYLLEGAPRGIPVPDVEDALRAYPGVLQIHDLHLWRISSGLDILTAHVVLEDPSKWRETQACLRNRLRERFGLRHATLQMEGREELDDLEHRDEVCGEH